MSLTRSESFLPFDLESLFSASFIVTLISAILPDTVADHTYRDMGFSLFDEMIARGNQVAQMRKSEIELLEDLCEPLQQPRPGDNEPPVVSPLSGALHAGPGQAPDMPEIVGSAALPIPQPEDELLFDWQDLGLSLGQMLSATDQLNANYSIRGEGGHHSDLWLWSDG